ncbi:MAG: Na+/H+ antiporter NhaC family protein [Eggerthellaceae bacterium]|nr:Na+/H+ antiporter NhaC family protein [Eggerthellaceae bacterium]
MALLPIVVFLVLYLGTGVYFEYIYPIEGQMGFYIMSVVVAFLVALTVALLQNRKLGFDDKLRVCARGVGDENIIIMIFIFLFAGVFSGLASEAGGAASTANMLLSVIPDAFVIPGLFLIAAVISLAMGTSVGTISVLVPIAVAVAGTAGLNLPFCVGTVVGGAMFGDNLSFISDTTIAATKTQGVAMKEKFYENIRFALPTAIITLVLLIVMTANSQPTSVGSYEFNLLLAIPYFVVLVLAMAGMNVFLVLGIGIVLFVIAGGFTGSLDYITAFGAMGNGASGMFETIIVTILVAAIGSLMREHGGFEAILAFVRKRFRGVRGGMAGIGLLTLLLDIAAANNTVAIVMAGPVAKQISQEYDVTPRQTASLMDTCSCIGQGIIPYGAQLLIAAGLAGISSVAIIPFLYYQFLLAAAVVVYIVTAGLKFGKAKA